MIANIIRYDLRNVSGVDHDADYEVYEDPDAREPITIPVWDTAKLGLKKTLAEYRIIGRSLVFEIWYKNWYRQRKIAHGHTPESAERKVRAAFLE